MSDTALQQYTLEDDVVAVPIKNEVGASKGAEGNCTWLFKVRGIYISNFETQNVQDLAKCLE